MSLSDTSRMVGKKSSANPSEPVPLAGSRGFTLIELLIVVVVVGILASVAMSSFTAVQHNARTVRCVAELRDIERVANDYAIEKGGFPADFDELSAYIGRDLIDPWGNRYVYQRYDLLAMRYYVVGEPLNTDFDLYSKGINGVTDLFVEHPLSRDDVFRARNGGFMGVTDIYLDSI